MALLRILLIALVAWLVIRMIRNWMDRKAVKPASKSGQIGTVVRCAHCGLHIPQQEAVHSGDRYYCSVEHSKAQRQEQD